jgi:hypothetical protein
LLEPDLLEVSPALKGANPDTYTIMVKSHAPVSRPDPESNPAAILARLDRLDPARTRSQATPAADQFLRDRALERLSGMVEESRAEAWRQLDEDERAR